MVAFYESVPDNMIKDIVKLGQYPNDHMRTDLRSRYEMVFEKYSRICVQFGRNGGFLLLPGSRKISFEVMVVQVCGARIGHHSACPVFRDQNTYDQSLRLNVCAF